MMMWMKFMVFWWIFSRYKAELLKIWGVLRENRYNVFFYLYVYFSWNFWKYVVILYLFLNFLALIKFIFLFKGGKIRLSSNKILDNIIFRYLKALSTAKNYSLLLVLVADIMIRYLIVFFSGASLKSITLLINFFNGYTKWNSNFIYPKILNIHKFAIIYLKSEFYSQIQETELDVKIIGRIRVITKSVKGADDSKGDL